MRSWIGIVTVDFIDFQSWLAPAMVALALVFSVATIGIAAVDEAPQEIPSLAPAQSITPAQSPPTPAGSLAPLAELAELPESPATPKPPVPVSEVSPGLRPAVLLTESYESPDPGAATKSSFKVSVTSHDAADSGGSDGSGGSQTSESNNDISGRESTSQPNRKNGKTAIVVCPPPFLGTLAPWVEYRQSQGYRILHLDGRMSAIEIVQSIRKIASNQPVHYVVLVGDADLEMASNPVIRDRSVPTFLAPAKHNVAFGSETHIATDNPYGDLNGDLIPELSVGRISADTPQELSIVVQKILDYERKPLRGSWRRNVQLVAGVGDFGKLADTLIETTAKKFITEGIPPEYSTQMTYGNWRSPFCPDPRSFRQSVLKGVQDGCLLWVYMGHGQPHRLDRLNVSDAVLPILEPSDVPKLRSQSGMPIAVLLACYTGAYDQDQDCLAERLLRTPGGPIAVLAASRVAMPYSMTILSTAMMDTFFKRQTQTLGELVHRGRMALAADVDPAAPNRKLVDSLAAALSPTRDDLAGERLEHEMIFNLLGDPLLTIRQPPQVQLRCPEKVVAGQRLQLVGYAPEAGTCTVELVCRRDRLTFSPTRRRQPETVEQLAEMNQTYRRANDPRWSHRRLQVPKGRFVISLPIPLHARGPSHARVFIESDDSLSLGAADVYIRGPEDSDLRTSNANR